MDGQITGGIIGLVFLLLCIGFLSTVQIAPHQASAHPFLAPGSSQPASVESAFAAATAR